MTTLARETPRRYDKAAPRRLRASTGLDINKAAKQARLARQTLLYLERGWTVPRADTLAKLARVYGVSPDAFFARVKVGAA